MKIGGWHRVFIVVAAAYLVISATFFINGYPSATTLRATIDKEFEARQAVADGEMQNKFRLQCKHERLTEKRASLSAQELNDVDGVLKIIGDPAVSIERKIKAHKNQAWLGNDYAEKETAFVDECVQIASSKSSFNVQNAADEFKTKTFAYELRLPAFAAMQQAYVVKALLVIFVPVVLLYALGLVTSWVVRGFYPNLKI